MRTVNRLRFIARTHLLPLVIGALVLRALIPAGFMPGAGGGFSLVATMCATPAMGTAGTETIEIPGGAPDGSHAHCDFCGLPILAGLSADAVPAAPAAIDLLSVPARLTAPHSRFALERAQIPRAPPLA